MEKGEVWKGSLTCERLEGGSREGQRQGGTETEEKEGEGRRYSARHLCWFHGGGHDVVVLALLGVGREIGIEPPQNFLQSDGAQLDGVDGLRKTNGKKEGRGTDERREEEDKEASR